MAWQSPRNRWAPWWWTRNITLLPVVTSWTSRLPPCAPLSTVSTAPWTGPTPMTPIIGRAGSFSRSFQWTTPSLTSTTWVLIPNSLCRTQSGKMPMPGQSELKPRPSTFMSRISTVSMSPGFAPSTSIGPVAPLTNGSATSPGVSCWPRRVMTPSLMLMAHSTFTASPGSIAATKRSVADSAYLMLPSLVTRVWLMAPPSERLSGLAPPGGEQPLELAHREREQQRQGDRRHQGGEHLGDDVEAAGLEDRVAEPLGRGHELADDGADQREADRQLEAGEDVDQRGRDDELPEDVALGGAQRAHEVDLVGIDARRPLVGGDQRHDDDREGRHRDLRGEPGGDREAQRGRAPGVADRRARAHGLRPGQGARARAAAAVELAGRAVRGCRRCLNTTTLGRRLRCLSRRA